MSINNLPGAIWPIIYGAIYLGLQTFVAAQWPDTPPAYVLGAMAALGVSQGLFKVFGPQPQPTPQTAADLPPGVSPHAGLSDVQHAQKQPGKLSRFLL